METFTIQPFDTDAKLAIGLVKQHANKFQYHHYIRVVGKTTGKMSQLSHIVIITSRDIAIEHQLLTPQEWLNIYSQRATNRFNREVSILC